MTGSRKTAGYIVSWPLWVQYALALAAVGGALAVRWLLTPVLQSHVPFLTVFAALLILVVTVRPGPFIAATLAALLGSLVLFTRVPSTPDGPVLIEFLLFGVALAAAGVAALLSGRSQDRLAKAHEQVDDRREALRVTLASIGDGVITTDTEGRVTFVNAIAEGLTGWSNDEARGLPLKQVFAIFNEKTRQEVPNPVDKVLESGNIVGLANHTVLVRRDGTECPIDDSAAPIRDAQGVISGVVLVFRDITQRRKVEIAIRESEERFRTLADAAPVLIWMSGPQKERIYFNRPWLQFTGKPLDEHLGEGWLSLVHQEDAAGLDEICGEGFRQRKPFTAEFRLRRHDGEYRWMLDTEVPRFDAAGGFAGFIGSCVDITERKQAEETRARLAAIVDSSDDAIVSKTLDGVIRSWNAGAERLFGYRADEAVGRHIHLIIPPELRAEEETILARLRRGEKIDHFETVRVAKDGRRLNISLTVSPVRDASGRIVGASKIARDTTQTTLAQHQINELTDDLRERLEERDALLRVLPVGIFVAEDPACERITMNPAGAAMLGLEHGANPSKTGPEAARLGFRVFMDGQEVPAGELPMQRAVRTGEPVWGETVQIVRQDGAERWLYEYAIPLFDQNGKVRGCLGAFVDISDRKRTEEALRKRAAEQAVLYKLTDQLQRATTLKDVYEATLDSIVDALGCQRASILIFDEGGVMRFVAWRGLSDDYRRAAEGHSPWKAEDADPQPVTIPDITRAQIDPALKQVIVAEGIRGLGFIPLMAQGRLVGKFMLYYDEPHDLSDQELELALTIARQLAFGVQRHRALNAMRESEQRLRLATATGKVGVWDWDIPANRVAWTDSLYEIHGLDKDRFAGTVEAFAELVYPEDAAFVSQAIKSSLAGESPYEIEFRALKPNGEVIWLLTSATVLRGSGGQPIRMIGATVDITAAKRAEEALREADRRKDVFLATLAHELRNPLAPICNALEIIRTAEQDRGLLEQARDTLDRQVRQLVRLVDDLLDVNRITRDRLELRKSRVQLDAILRQAVETFRSIASGEGQRIELELPDQQIVLEADPARLTQIFNNLLHNACKYTQRGGLITVRLWREGSDAVASFKDNGIGIPRDQLQGIFEMFAQVDTTLERSRGGLGIGLTLVRRLVELHGGSVTARSEGPGRGSEFTVRLPLVIGGTIDAGHGPNGAPARRLGTGRVGWRVLIVDDNVDAASTLATLLSRAGSTTQVASDGLSAVRQAEEFRPEVILLDIGLPEMNGYDVCRAIRAKPWGGSVAIVALTGWGHEQDRARSREAGFDEHLVKPLDPEGLPVLLASLVDGRRQAAPS
jgi:PAS domain S-box-containing protein